MAKRGPKIIQVDWQEFDKLCYMQCTATEIAAWFNCSVDTIENRVKQEHGVKFSDYYAEKKQAGKISLRRAQFQAATVKGNTSMMIWLGKQYLDQKDHRDVEVKTTEVLTATEEKMFHDITKAANEFLNMANKNK